MNKERKGIDIKNLTIIDASEVPAQPKRYTPYRQMLKKVRKGKALVISDEEINIDAARAGIRRLQKKGEFTKLKMTQRKAEDGIRRLYVINPPSEEGPE